MLFDLNLRRTNSPDNSVIRASRSSDGTVLQLEKVHPADSEVPPLPLGYFVLRRVCR